MMGGRIAGGRFAGFCSTIPFCVSLVFFLLPFLMIDTIRLYLYANEMNTNFTFPTMFAPKPFLPFLPRPFSVKRFPSRMAVITIIIA